MFIYRIYNIDTNESYIGQTVKAIDDRFKEHIREAKRSFRGEKRDFPFFHRALLYYGIEKFIGLNIMIVIIVDIILLKADNIGLCQNYNLKQMKNGKNQTLIK